MFGKSLESHKLQRCWIKSWRTAMHEL